MFPPQQGMSAYHSPQAIVEGKSIDYRKHCMYSFGSYVQALHETNPTNTTRPRTIGCIFLSPNVGDNTSYNLMNLNTGKLITRRKVFLIPITEEVIERVESLASKDGMKTDIIFKTRTGDILDDELNNKESSDDDENQQDDSPERIEEEIDERFDIEEVEKVEN